MGTKMDEWLKELIGDSDENSRLVAREKLKAQVSEAIWGLINKSTLRRKDAVPIDRSQGVRNIAGRPALAFGCA